MRKFVLGMMVLAGLASAEKDFFGLGIFAQAGKYSGGGAHGRFWVSQKSTVDILFRYADGATSLGAEYKLQNYGLIPVSVGQLPVYYGIGGYMVLSGDPMPGISIPVGMSYEFAGAPFDVFGELAPSAAFDGAFDVPLRVGAHFYF